MARVASLQDATDRDLRLARWSSAALHLAILLLLGRAAMQAPPKTTVIFTVETVAGIRPLGQGSGAPGDAARVSNTPANPNPLAGGLRLNVDDLPPKLKAPKPANPKASPKDLKAAQLPPSRGELEQRYQQLKIGVDPKDLRSSPELSEGGMGNARLAGAEGGLPGITGPIAGRGHTVPDFSYGKPLPEESEVVVWVNVNARGEVVSSGIKKTSGYPELDQHVLARAREIRFDPLPAGAAQDDQTGTIPFRFEFSGRMRR